MRTKDSNKHLIQSKVQSLLLTIGQARQSLAKVAAVIYESTGQDATLAQILGIFRASGFMGKESELMKITHQVATQSARAMSILTATDERELRDTAAGLPPLPTTKYLKAKYFHVEKGKVSLAPELQEKIKEDCTVKIDPKTMKLIEWAEAYCDLMNRNPGVGFRGKRKTLPVVCVLDGDKLKVDIDLIL